MIHKFARFASGSTARLLMTTALITGAGSLPSWAQNATWGGAVGPEFADEGNWIDGALPGAGGIAIFEGAAEGASAVVNLGDAQTVGSIAVNDIGSIGGGTLVFENDVAAAQLIYRDADADALTDSLRLDLNGQGLSVVAETDMTLSGEVLNRGIDDAVLNLSTLDTAAMVLSGDISDAAVGGVISVVVSAGNVTLSGANDFAGNTTIAGGTLTLDGGQAINDDGMVVVDGTLSLASSDETIGALAGGANGRVALEGRTLSVAGGEASRFDGRLDGDGRLVVDNDTELTLGGDNGGFNGDLRVRNDSTLIAAGALGTGDILLDGDGEVVAAQDMTIANTINVSSTGGIISAASGARLTLTGDLAHNGGLVFGDETLSGVIVLENTEITGTGTATIATNNEVVLSSDASAALLENGLVVNGTLDLGGVSTDLEGITGTGLIRSSPGEEVTLTLTGNESFRGGFADGVGGQVTVVVDPGTSGRATFAGTGSTYSGNTEVNSGTLVVQGGDAISDNSTVVIAPEATLDLGSSETIGGLAGTGTIDVGVGALTIASIQDGGFSGEITGSGGLTFDGSGDSSFTLTSANNSYSGDTAINDATLFVDGGNAIGNSSVVQIGAGGALGLFADEIVRSLNNEGQLTIGANALTVNRENVVNTGQIELSDGGRFNIETLVNSGLVAAGGTSVLNGDLINEEGGTIALAGNGVSGDRLEVLGDATLNGTVTFDLALEQGTARADSIAITGELSGDVTLAFTDLSTESGTIADGVSVLSFGSLSPDFSFSQNSLPSSGAVIYALGLDDETNSLEIRSAPNPAVAGISAGLTLTQSLINTVVNRPTSPFVAGLAADDGKPCGVGSWVRGTGGTADATGSTQTAIGSFDSQIEATYSGLQFGFDYSCFDERFAGFDLSFGAIAGVNNGALTQPVFRFNTATLSQDLGIQTSTNETDFTQTYGGVYLGASRDRLFADLQLRFDRTSFELLNRALLPSATNGGADDIGVADQDYDSKSTTISGSVGYAFPLNTDGSFNFVPAVGVALSKTSVDDLRFDGGTPDTTEDDGLLQIDDINSNVAFLSGTLSRSKVLPSGTAALNYFGTVTYYQDFGSDTTSRFFEVDAAGAAIGDPLTTTSSNLGSYTEISVGLNYTKLIEPGRAAGARQFDASVRLDGRFSGGLDGYGVTAQVRYQF